MKGFSNGEVWFMRQDHYLWSQSKFLFASNQSFLQTESSESHRSCERTEGSEGSLRKVHSDDGKELSIASNWIKIVAPRHDFYFNADRKFTTAFLIPTWDLKIAEAQTKVSAPTSATSPMVFGEIPPSTSNRISLPVIAIMDDVSLIFPIISGMNSCPE